MASYILINLLKKLAVFAALLVFFNFFIYTNVVYCLVLVMAALYISEFTYSVVWKLLPKRMLPNLSEKAVLVTGCGSGFGYELAKKLDKLGVTVFAGCRVADGEGALKLKNSCSDRLQVLQLDVTKDNEVREAVKTVEATLQGQKLWAVVNNAGVAVVSEVEWTPIEDYQKLMDVNAFGAIRIVQTFLPLLRKSKGRVVFVTSFGCRVTCPGLSSYSMAKHAAVSLSDALRREMMKWSVSVHYVIPWIYRTKMTHPKRVSEEADKLWAKAPRHIKETYGQEHFELFKRAASNTHHLSRPESAVSEVINDIIHACVGRNPKVSYIPGVTSLVNVCAYFKFCDELTDVILHTGLYKIIPKLPPVKYK